MPVHRCNSRVVCASAASAHSAPIPCRITCNGAEKHLAGQVAHHAIHILVCCILPLPHTCWLHWSDSKIGDASQSTRHSNASCENRRRLVRNVGIAAADRCARLRVRGQSNRLNHSRCLQALTYVHRFAFFSAAPSLFPSPRDVFHGLCR